MKEFITYIIKNLVDQPDSVSVEMFEGQNSLVVEVHVSDEDIAKVIGKQGRTIKSLRSIASTIATRLQKKVRIEVIQ